jgi:hypothetical protein
LHNTTGQEQSVLLDAGFDLAAKKSKKVIVVPLILNADIDQFVLRFFPQPTCHFCHFTIGNFIR